MINYNELFTALKENLHIKEIQSTPEITREIKRFFVEKFNGYFVAPNNGTKEFMVDVFISNINPRKIHESNGQELIPILALESELGGNGGGAPGILKGNVFEDFAKLLVIQSQYKVLIFTSLPYKEEPNHIESRVQELYEYYDLSPCQENILLVHLEAESQKTKNNQQTNPKIHTKRENISGYLLLKGVGVQNIA
ncbi:hypothetical protein F7U73_21080 [Vibrio vulnificus]|nr:hypothetical protein [Vibrio vulnificus]